MVAEDRHLSVSSVVGQHLGGHIVVRVGQLVQLLLQGEGGVVCPGEGRELKQDEERQQQTFT